MPAQAQRSRPPRSRAGRPRTDPARRAAYDVLRAVADRDAYANLLLPAVLSERGITARDAVFVGTGSRPVRLGDVQAPGKRRMTAPEWARGLRSGGPVRFG